jgi:hypothetical protein
MNPLSPVQVGWLAGILDGEGSFKATISCNGAPTNKARLGVRVRMCNEKPPQRCFELTGIGHLRPAGFTKARIPRPIYEWEVGRREDVCALLEVVEPHLTAKSGQARTLLTLADTTFADYESRQTLKAYLSFLNRTT